MDLLLEYDEKILTVFLLFTISIYFRVILQVLGQTWIKTISHTSTIVILPIITYIITNVISGNIALSLGMVGALSIVRFRNPVRSPLELSVYFGAITMGITAAVSIKWLIFLFISLSSASLGLIIIHYLYLKIAGKQFFITSFSEGNSLSTINILTSDEIEILDTNFDLMSKTKTNNEISYTLASSNFKTLQDIEFSVRSLKGVKSIQLNR
jgi:hypothetical protein